jgi:hypothetical protein
MEQISQICVVWGNAVALSRYHLSPHSTNLVGIRLLPEQRVQAPGNFNCDAPWAGRVSEDRYRLYKLTNCLSRFGISGIDALGQGVLKMAELLFIARQYAGWREMVSLAAGSTLNPIAICLQRTSVPS